MNNHKSNTYTSSFEHDGHTYKYADLGKFGKEELARLPLSIRILLEAGIRKLDDFTVVPADIKTILNWGKHKTELEIPFYPSRVLLQDYTGVPTIVDLACIREAMNKINPSRISEINPSVPVELVVDHSIQVDSSGTTLSIKQNENKEFERNKERFRLLKWGQKTLNNLKIVPPGSGIVHQVNLEALARVVFKTEDSWLYPDSVIGTDSHTTMINGLGVLGWGVGGIEAEAVMLGEFVTMLLPEVIGVEITGSLKEGVCSTDAVLTLTNLLRKVNVVGKFVEFFGEGLEHLSVQDRATMSNMAPEYGATAAYFPLDDKTFEYLIKTGRDKDHLRVAKMYLQKNHLFRESETEKYIEFTKKIVFDLTSVLPTMAGPKRPQDLKAISIIKQDFLKGLTSPIGPSGFGLPFDSLEKEIVYEGYKLKHGSVLIAAITSCTNTSNPYVLMAAGLMAKNAVRFGLKVPSYVKTSLSPGSRVVTKYFQNSGLDLFLNELGFNLAGYGCMTCIGNSGDLKDELTKICEANKDMVFASVLSGNRNFEGRVHPFTKANYLAAPVYVVAYALAGRVDINFEKEPIGKSSDGKTDVYLKDIFPTDSQVRSYVDDFVTRELFVNNYLNNYLIGNQNWEELVIPESPLYDFDKSSTYIQNPPYFDHFGSDLKKVTEYKNLKCILYLGDSITTDHISPAGNISKVSSTAKYLNERHITAKDFNSYGSRRGNHEIMVRGTFANITLKNKMIPGVEGPYSVSQKGDQPIQIFEVAEKNLFDNLIILAGKEYGTGSSRDWAAKGPKLMGVKVVIAESYERIHRSNLIGMAILPLQFKEGESAESLGLTGFETFSMKLDGLKSKSIVHVESSNGVKFETLARIDTEVELEYLYSDGILPYVFRKLIKGKK